MMRRIQLSGRRLGSILFIWLCCWFAFMSGPASAAPELSLIAGNIVGPGAKDGTGAAARFRTPSGIAADTAGNLYIADSKNHNIRKISPAGVVTTLAGVAQQSGSADGNGAAARFNAPFDIAVGAAGKLYVADSGNHTIRVISPTGAVTTLAGTAGAVGSADGTGANARFNSPGGITADADGNLYVTDTFNHVIRRITPAGAVTTIAGMAQMPGNADGNVMAARFNTPVGIALDREGNLYVADTGNHTIRKISPAGVVTTVAGTAGSAGALDGTGPNARFNLPYGVAVDGVGNLYVGDSGNYTIRRITPAGVVATVAGSPGNGGNENGSGGAARFFAPTDLLVDATGTVYIVDTGNNAIRKLTPAGEVATVAGPTSVVGSTDGSGAAARFNTPLGIAPDTSGNLIVADMGNHTLRKITPAGVVTTLAGTAGTPGAADGTGAAAGFNTPTGITADKNGNTYVADTGNHTIRKVTSAGVVTTLAGTAGRMGSADGTGAAAQFNSPIGIASDAAGNLYVADTGNHTVRKVTPTGEVTTLAGTAGSFSAVDGTGLAARFVAPFGIAVDSAGNLYVADTGNHAIRKVTQNRVVTTLAGTLEIPGSADGAGTAAQFNLPVGISTDVAGNVYVADTGNHTIRMINSAGQVSTLAGRPGSAGITLGPLPGSLEAPLGVAPIGANTLALTSAHSVLRLSKQ
jgi:sugar lactone lactonase YvrE